MAWEIRNSKSAKHDIAVALLNEKNAGAHARKILQFFGFLYTLVGFLMCNLEYS
jgi:hypothetical protein